MAARLIHTVGVGCGTLRLVALHDMYFRHKDLFGINTVVNGRPVHSRSKNLVPTASQFRVSMASDTENVTAEHLRMIERSEAVTKATVRHSYRDMQEANVFQGPFLAIINYCISHCPKKTS